LNIEGLHGEKLFASRFRETKIAFSKYGLSRKKQAGKLKNRGRMRLEPAQASHEKLAKLNRHGQICTILNEHQIKPA